MDFARFQNLCAPIGQTLNRVRNNYFNSIFACILLLQLLVFDYASNTDGSLIGVYSLPPASTLQNVIFDIRYVGTCEFIRLCYEKKNKMKIRRYKKVNKNLGFFTNNFGFRQPYQLLADGTFCFAALNNKVNASNDLPKYLQSEIKLITTQCAIMEMEKLGPKLNGALLILKNYVVHKCEHQGKPISGSACLLSMVSKDNPSHYMVCTQDRDLQEKIRKLPGVPLLYLHVKTPVLEQPSEASVKRAEEKVSGLVQSELEKLNKLKEKEGLVSNEDKKPKKRKKKGANPLSCKKKQKKPQQNPIKKKEGSTEVEKKKRKKVRIPKHVKEEMLKRTFMKINEIA